MNTGQLFLNAILLGLGTYFWCWYLTWEATHYKSRGQKDRNSAPKKWYEREIFPKERKDQ